MITRYESDLDPHTHLAVLSAIADTLDESVMITEAGPDTTDPKIIYVNPSFTALTGYQAEEAIGQTPKLLQGGRTERPVLERLKHEVLSRHTWKGETYNYTKAGHEFLMQWEIVPIHDTEGNLRFYLTVQRREDDPTPSDHRRLDALRRWGSPD